MRKRYAKRPVVVVVAMVIKKNKNSSSFRKKKSSLTFPERAVICAAVTRVFAKK